MPTTRYASGFGTVSGIRYPDRLFEDDQAGVRLGAVLECPVVDFAEWEGARPAKTRRSRTQVVTAQCRLDIRSKGAKPRSLSEILLAVPDAHDRDRFPLRADSIADQVIADDEIA